MNTPDATERAQSQRISAVAGQIAATEQDYEALRRERQNAAQARRVNRLERAAAARHRKAAASPGRHSL